MLSFENYHVVKENIKLSKKEARAEKREMRKEMVKERISAFTEATAARLSPAYNKVRGLLPFKDDEE